MSFLWICQPAQAGWLIDEARRHTSAHGRMECLECHGETARAAQHPNADRVDRGPDQPFTPERCTVCHGSVVDDFAKGEHGGRPADPSADYDRCTGCHNPHEQVRSADAARFDPARPTQDQCGSCHAQRARLPEPSRDDDTCLSCHSRYDLSAPGAARAARTLCLACHGREHAGVGPAGVARVPVVDLGPEGLAPHQDVACLTCHPQSAEYGHSGRATADCRRCHTRHPESVTHDAHLSVACEACHLSEIAPVRDAATGQVRWVRQSGRPSRVHVMSAQPDEAGCRRCHTSPNRIGAAAAVLPPKSVLCMPCHPAVFTAGDAVTIAALLALGLGLIGSLSFWFSGARAARAERVIGAPVASRLAAVARALIWEGLLQRTFFRRSPGRWLLHALIVWPILLRLLWGLAAWAGSRWTPAAAWPWVMLDKNGWANGLFFDLTGLAVIAGAGLAAGFGRREGAAAAMPGMPRPDWVSFGLLGALMLAGFVLEGARIAMTGYPPGSGWAFVGDALSRVFHRSAGLEDIYGWLWYSHAALTGLFVAWLPFGRMFHIALAPVLLAVNAWGSPSRPRPPGHGSGN